MTTTYSKRETFDGGMCDERAVYVNWSDINRLGTYSDTAVQRDGYPSIQVRVLPDGSVEAREVHCGGSGPRVVIPKPLLDLLVAFIGRDES